MSKEIKEEIISLSFPKNKIDKDINKACSLRKIIIPSSIFKYLNIEVEKDENNKDVIYSLENLKNNSVWLSNPNDFNDPYDGHFFFDLEKSREYTSSKDMKNILKMDSYSHLSEVEKKDIKDSKNPIKTYISILNKKSNVDTENLQKEINSIGLKKDIKKMKNKFRISSFSEVNNSILMWSHYAKNHTGFCIEYETGDDKLLSELFPVVYTDDFFDITDAILTEDIYKPYMLQSVFRKCNVWEYEQEWRIVYETKDNINGYLHKIEEIKAVYMGTKIENSNKKELEMICKDKKIDLYQMELSDEKFELISKLVSSDE